MFGKRKKDVKLPVESFDTVLDKSIYRTMFDALTAIKTLRCEVEGPNGKEEDVEQTVRFMRDKARMTLDFVAEMKKNTGLLKEEK